VPRSAVARGERKWLTDRQMPTLIRAIPAETEGAYGSLSPGASTAPARLSCRKPRVERLMLGSGGVAAD